MEKSTEDITQLSSEEQLERLSQLNASMGNNPDVDLWSLNSELLGRWPEIMLYRCQRFNP